MLDFIDETVIEIAFAVIPYFLLLILMCHFAKRAVWTHDAPLTAAPPPKPKKRRSSSSGGSDGEEEKPDKPVEDVDEDAPSGDAPLDDNEEHQENSALMNREYLDW
ncbi:unnamed protein product [Meganyctiphanes norvegica]|uniref:Uncharacterized protein n=1 Tax=Meganyctiphanes norvegica TaxID=48144 RepID=A0AAV2QVJ2_MEGNR